MASTHGSDSQRSGDARLQERLPALVSRVYEDLLAIAHSYWAGQPADATLQPTALVHEAVLKVLAFDQAREANGSSRSPTDVQHLLAVMARAMRQVLVDQARQRGSAKRRGGVRVELPSLSAPDVGLPSFDLLDLDMALNELAVCDPRAAEVVELRFFGRLSVDEVAEALEVGKTTAEEEWRCARAWLKRRLREHRLHEQGT